MMLCMAPACPAVGANMELEGGLDDAWDIVATEASALALDADEGTG